jgi:uncharacterized membrane protein
VSEPETPAGAQLDLVLRPHRSLSPLGFWIIMAVLAAFSFVGGIVFWLAGAWPVIGFLGIDVVLVYIAFKASYAGGRAYERVRLSPDLLTVERVDAYGRREAFSLPPHWLRVELEDSVQRSELRLASHGRSLTIGAFLPPEERAEVADVIRAALARRSDPSTYSR